jgi:integrase
MPDCAGRYRPVTARLSDKRVTNDHDRGLIMGFVRPRTGVGGTVRYQALYDDVKGDRRSAGTFNTWEKATRAWQRAEDRLAEGRLTDTRRGRQRFDRYVTKQWLPNHQMEARTREGYTYYLDLHILPAFGAQKMNTILPGDVREWVTDLKDAGVTPHVTRCCMTVLSAIFTTALNDRIIQLHPCRGVKTPPVPKKVRTIITPEQFDQFYAALPSDLMRLLVEVDIETGVRWGELTELRPKDFDLPSRILTVQRVVVELVPKFHPTGGRFLVKEYPKDQEHRQMKLSTHLVDEITAHITEQSLGPDDLLFAMPPQPPRPLPELVDPDDLGLTAPNAAGHTYRHGTLSGYSAGHCHCQHCRGAYARYRAERRQAGKDQPRQPRTVDTDGHIPRNWFRNHIWVPALKASKLTIKVTPHGLRHAHASWLLAGGADLQVVKERLGHASIVTTQRYLHTLDDVDETALDALSRTRNRSTKRTTRATEAR